MRPYFVLFLFILGQISYGQRYSGFYNYRFSSQTNKRCMTQEGFFKKILSYFSGGQTECQSKKELLSPSNTENYLQENHNLIAQKQREQIRLKIDSNSLKNISSQDSISTDGIQESDINGNFLSNSKTNSSLKDDIGNEDLIHREEIVDSLPTPTPPPLPPPPPPSPDSSIYEEEIVNHTENLGSLENFQRSSGYSISLAESSVSLSESLDLFSTDLLFIGLGTIMIPTGIMLTLIKYKTSDENKPNYKELTYELYKKNGMIACRGHKQINIKELPSKEQQIIKHSCKLDVGETYYLRIFTPEHVLVDNQEYIIHERFR